MARMPESKEPGRGFKLVLSDSERVVEANWELMQAEGYRPYWTGNKRDELTAYSAAIDVFGPGNVLQGDAYYDAEARPLRHIPGATIYVRDDQQAGLDGASSSRNSGP